MLEIVILGLLIASLGLLVAGSFSWFGWQQKRLKTAWEEEEVLTQYESRDNAPDPDHPSSEAAGAESGRRSRLSGWEFKIVRSKRHAFRSPKILKRVCEQEAEAGWILLEKLDERRLRFKRPMILRDRIAPETLKRDPYRTRYGSPINVSTLLIFLALILTLALPAYLSYTLVYETLSRSREDSLPPSPTPQFSPTLPPLRQPFQNR